MPEPYDKTIEGWDKLSQDQKEKAMRSAMIAEGVVIPPPESAKPAPKENIKVVATVA